MTPKPAPDYAARPYPTSLNEGDLPVLSFFAGAGGLDTGFKNAGFTIPWANEYDKNITPTLAANFPNTFIDDRSLFKVESSEIPDGAVGIVGGPPCFPAGTFVLTENGYTDIADIQLGDMVMTHEGRYRRVFDFGTKEAEVIEVKLFGSPSIRCTPNHPFYVVEREVTAPGEEIFSSPFWLAAEKLTEDHFVLSPLGPANSDARDQSEPLELFEVLLDRDNSPRFQGIPGTLLSASREEQEEVLQLLQNHFGAQGDEQISEGHIIFGGVSSLQAALGVQRLVRNLYQVEAEISPAEGQKQPVFQVRWSPDAEPSPHYLFTEDYLYSQVIQVSAESAPAQIFNFSVEEDESYTVNNFAVHNCQSWSLGGAGRGLDDKRGAVFLEYIRVINDKQPLFFLAENVKGMLARTRKDDLDVILKKFDDLGYNLTYHLVNAHDYGVPEDRWRVIFVGYRQDMGKTFQLPPVQEDRPTFRDAIWDLQENPTPALPLDRTNGDTLDLANHEYSTGGFSPQYMSRNRTRLWDEPSFTIQASGRQAPLHPSSGRMVKVNADLHEFADPENHRRLTVREAARVQTFPDTHKFVYDRLDTGYKMVGNAVPVKLAEAFASSIMADVEEFYRNKA